MVTPKWNADSSIKCDCGKPAWIRKTGECHTCYYNRYRDEHKPPPKPSPTPKPKPVPKPKPASVTKPVPQPEPITVTEYRDWLSD